MAGRSQHAGKVDLLFAQRGRELIQELWVLWLGWPSLVGWYGTGATAQDGTGADGRSSQTGLDWEDSVDRGSGWSSTSNPTKINVQAAGQSRNSQQRMTTTRTNTCKIPRWRRPGWLRWEFLEVTIDRLSDPRLRDARPPMLPKRHSQCLRCH